MGLASLPFIVVAILCVGLVYAVFQKSKKGKLFQRVPKFVDDPEAWKKAEEAVRTDKTLNDFTYLSRFDSEKGFDESSMTRIMSYLASQEVESTFRTFVVGIEPGGFSVHQLYVRKGHEDKAKAALDRGLAQGEI